MKIFYNSQPTMHLEELQQKWFDALNYAATNAKNFQHQNFTNDTRQSENEKVFTISPSVLDELIAKHEAKGRLEGRAKGRVEGKVKGKAEIIIRILSRRLESPSKPLLKKIKSVQNTIKLDELADFALTCLSLDDFSTALE
jgi:predicted transposase YdaD